MTFLHPTFALEVARQFARERADEARMDRLARDLAAARSPLPSSDRSRMRPGVAALLRRVGAIADWLASIAGHAATRVDGPAA